MGDRAREYFAARAVGPCRPWRIITGAALLQKAIRPETSSAPMIATASTRPGEPGTSPYEIDAARRAFEEKLKMAPEYAAFFDRLKTVFPSE